ncbi:hypothetical protein SAMN05216464_106235 [Mucilaginibacter pineti]|uniref:Uncharacterized protein n=1 Tax=Mucilaginibacter pineti TaxID=1391627 RepID=A0A1G7D4D6_9SPHI|nr:hypothetical protein [Mucilaginibacter pineti]SDE46361.1 hypothetical protein SAMN05216464_106235 [Mucilaginibacter pineti]
MDEIKSKRSIDKFCSTMLPMILIFIILGALALSLYNEGIGNSGKIGMLFMGSAYVLTGIYLIYQSYMVMPSFTVDLSGITLRGRRRFLWTDLAHIELSGKRPGIKFTGITEGMKIQFIGGPDIYLYDDLYTNIAPVKRFIARHVIGQDEIPEYELHRPDLSDVVNEKFVYYKSAQFLNHRGIIIWLSLFLLLYLGIINHFQVGWLLFIVLGWICFRGISGTMYYFGVSDNYLIVKNHNLFWKKELFKLTEIKEAVFEMPGNKRPNPLRIITKDFKSNVYKAGKLWDKNWRALKKALESKGVHVRNQNYIQ